MINDRPYQLSPSLKAVSEDEFNPSFGELKAKQLGHIIYSSKKDLPLNHFSKAKLVAKSESTGFLVVITGLFILKLKQGASIARVESHYPLDHYYSAQGIETHYFYAREKVDLFELLELLKKGPWIESPRLEVIEAVAKVR